MLQFGSLSRQIVEQLKLSLIEKDFKATGKTIAAIHEANFPDGFQILAPDYIDNLEKGTPPGTVASLSDLAAWIQARGLSGQMDSKGLQARLKKQGSLLYQGRDPRFPGQRSSGAISDVIDEDLKSTLVEKVSQMLTDDFLTQFKAVVKANSK